MLSFFFEDIIVDFYFFFIWKNINFKFNSCKTFLWFCGTYNMWETIMFLPSSALVGKFKNKFHTKLNFTHKAPTCLAEALAYIVQQQQKAGTSKRPDRKTTSHQNLPQLELCLTQLSHSLLIYLLLEALHFLFCSMVPLFPEIQTSQPQPT